MRGLWLVGAEPQLSQGNSLWTGGVVLFPSGEGGMQQGDYCPTCHGARHPAGFDDLEADSSNKT